MDKELGRWYLSLNPALERTIHGPSADDGFGFAPGAKVGYDVTPKINVGVEYYGSYGPVRAPESCSGAA